MSRRVLSLLAVLALLCGAPAVCGAEGVYSQADLTDSREWLAFDSWGSLVLSGGVSLDAERLELEVTVYGWSRNEESEEALSAAPAGYRVYALGLNRKGKSTRVQLGDMEPEIDGAFYFGAACEGLQKLTGVRIIALDEDGKEIPGAWNELSVPEKP